MARKVAITIARLVLPLQLGPRLVVSRSSSVLTAVCLLLSLRFLVHPVFTLHTLPYTRGHTHAHTHRGTGTGLGLCLKQSAGNCLPESRLASLRELERNRVRPCPAFQGPAACGRRLSGSLRPGALGTVGARGLGGGRRREEPRQGDIWAALHGNTCLLKSFVGRPKKRSR